MSHLLSRRPVIAALLLAAGGSAASPILRAVPKAEIGGPAPAFSARDSAGRTIQSGAYAGRLLILEWSHPICPFTAKHYASGGMQALQAQARDAGGAWFTVLSQPPHTIGHLSDLEAELLAEERRARADATLLDSTTELAALFGARATPHLFIIDRRGVLVYGGGMDSIASIAAEDIGRAIPYARLALEATIAGRPVPYPITRPYGCPIKYATGTEIEP